MSERDAFVEEKWDEMRQRMESGGAQSTAEFVESFTDPERRKLYVFSQRAFGGRDWNGKSLDKNADLVEFGIREMLRQSEAETDPGKSKELLDLANILSFNLSLGSGSGSTNSLRAIEPLSTRAPGGAPRSPNRAQ